MHEDEQAVDIKRMAHILNISTATLYTKIRAGDVPAMKIGQMWRMFPSKVIAHLEAASAPPPPGTWKQSAATVAAHRAAATRRRLAAERAALSQSTKLPT